MTELTNAMELHVKVSNSRQTRLGVRIRNPDLIGAACQSEKSHLKAHCKTQKSQEKKLKV